MEGLRCTIKWSYATHQPDKVASPLGAILTERQDSQGIRNETHTHPIPTALEGI